MASLALNSAAARLSPPHHHRPFSLKRPCPAQLCLRSSVAATSVSSATAIVWFKKDLRLDDHPGLLASQAYDLVLPLYIFDPYMLRWCSNRYLEGLVKAVRDLRRSLQSLGSGLIVRTGSIPQELSALAEQVQASDIITEQEIEHEWNHLLSSVSVSLQKSVGWGQVKCLQFWTAPLYQIECKQLPPSYRDFQRMRCAVNSPLHAPESLPALPKNLNAGNVPLVSGIKDVVKQVLRDDPWYDSFKSLENGSAEAVGNSGSLLARRDETCMVEDLSPLRKTYVLAGHYNAPESEEKDLVKEKYEGDDHRAGASSARAAQDGYLRFVEPTPRDKRSRETCAGAPFRIRLGQALALGRISRRTVYHGALEFEKNAHSRGWPSFELTNLSAEATIFELNSIEWYHMLSRMTVTTLAKKGLRARTWRWRGFLIQYSVMGSYGPPIVLVHGFGAFWEQYRDNIKGLSTKGSRVWALTLLGFGRSEKPNVSYTELLWAELIKDFIVEVVGEPVNLVGNSIGGYVVSMVAGLWPRIVSNLILLNPAGAVVPDRPDLGYLKPRAKSGVSWAAARLILLYMRGISNRLLKKCYPVSPWRADDWLTGEVQRASFDPGAPVVIESLLCWRKPLPITWFIDRYEHDVYLIQGCKDPLGRPIQRAESLKTHCNNVKVKLLDAGHCPHDEMPGEVNKLITEWIQKPVWSYNKMDQVSHTSAL